MKTLYALLIILLFAQIICDADNVDGCEDAEKKNADECNKIGPDEGGYRCCFIKGKFAGESWEGCASVTKTQYDDIDDAIEAYEKAWGADIDSLDCGSNYIIISLLSLILLFL